MKLFYKNDFRVVRKELEGLKKEYEILNEKYSKNDYKFFEDYCKYKDKCERLEKIENEHQKENGSLRKELEELEIKCKKLSGSKGGLIRENNKLNNVIKELTEKLEQIKKNKYLVRKIPSGRTPKGQRIGVKRVCQNNEVQKILKEKKD